METIDYRLFQSHRYALVDATDREAIPADWPQAVIAPAFLENDTARCPLLIDLGALPAETRGAWMQALETQVQNREETMCSLLLASDAPLSHVARHLSTRITVKLTANDPPRQFRYFDPGTFLQLPGLLGERGMAWLMGNISSVVVPWAGHWGLVQRPTPAATLAAGFALHPDHLQTLLRVGIVNRVASQMAAATNQADWIVRCEHIATHVQRAQQVHGLTIRDDLVAFAQHAMQHHPRFDEHPRIQRLFMELSHAKPEDELDYRELSNRITPEAWQQLLEQIVSKAPLVSTMPHQGKPP